jgi:hypothetical protein
LQNDRTPAPIVRFSEFLGIGYFGDKKQRVIAPIFERTYIKFGWHDLTKPYKFDVLPHYAAVDSIEFRKAEDIKPGMLVDKIRKS